jgi:hypothetical protein
MKFHDRILTGVTLTVSAAILGHVAYKLGPKPLVPTKSDYGLLLFIFLLNLRQPHQRRLERSYLLAVSVGVLSFALHPLPQAHGYMLDFSIIVTHGCYLPRFFPQYA